jgi:hypothetical protein
MRATRLFLIVSLFFLATEIAIADSVVASASLNWSAAAFSGAVAPAPLPLPSGASTQLSTAHQGLESPFPSSVCFAETIAWTAASCSTQIGPNDFATASSNSELTTVAAVSALGNEFGAATIRAGTIVVGTNGTVSISIPFTATITPSGPGDCGPCIDAFIDGRLDLFAPNNLDFVGGDDFFLGGVFGMSGDSASSSSGILNFSDAGLTPGTYHFQVTLTDDVTFVPEPSTYLLIGIGLLSLAGIPFRKRFA